MAIKVIDYINVKERALELGCNIPTGRALLPTNFDTAYSKVELVHEDSASTIRSLLRQAGLTETKLEKENEYFFEDQKKSLEIALPTIFVGISLITQNPVLLTITFNVISTYLTDFFKGLPGAKKAKLDIVIENEKGQKYSRLHYEGNVEGLADLPAIIQEMQENA